MDAQRRWELNQRLLEIKAELRAIGETRVTSGDPTSLEDQLLDELDALNFELGVGHFRPISGG
jgi:hypothetical protein